MRFHFASLFFLALSQAEQAPSVIRRDLCGHVDTTAAKCLSIGCIWDKSCYYPKAEDCSRYQVISGSNGQPSTLSRELRLSGTCYTDSIPKLNLDVSQHGDHTQRIRIYQPLSQNGKPEYSYPPSVLEASLEPARGDSQLQVHVQSEPFQFQVYRKGSHEPLISTQSQQSYVNHLVYRQDYRELSLQLPANSRLFGLGESVTRFQRRKSGFRQTMWARDVPAEVDHNAYGTHPFSLVVTEGQAFGIFLSNPYAMDIIYSDDILTYKTLGGEFDFLFFSGPTPHQVVEQYTKYVGRPGFVSWWALGFQHCRWGYNDLQEVKDVVEGYKQAEIPLETMWTDIEYMDSFKDFTFDEVNFPQQEIAEFVEDLHANDQRYVLILDPAIKVEKGYDVYESGLKEDVFIKCPNGKPYEGLVWPGVTSFPDFGSYRTWKWWKQLINKFVASVNVDGLWLDMNEAANFANGTCGGIVPETSFPLNNGQNFTALNIGALPLDSVYTDGSTGLERHNVYGALETAATYHAMREANPTERPFLLSRSTIPGSGRYTGHWTGDNWSTWEYYRMSIPGVLNFQLFGIPYVGVDICGFTGNTTMELCARWMSLGSFFPFSRNHNAIKEESQEPYLWPEVAEASRNALSVRYSLLSYYYTLMHQAHVQGTPVMNSLFLLNPEHEELADVDWEMMVGKDLLIAPVVTEGATSTDVIFPPGTWYDWYTGRAVVASPKSTQLRVEAPLEHIPVFVRGGSILPVHVAKERPFMTTKAVKQSSMKLRVSVDNLRLEGVVEGKMYADDGITMDAPSFEARWVMRSAHNGGLLRSSIVSHTMFDGYVSDNKLEGVEVHYPFEVSVVRSTVPYTVSKNTVTFMVNSVVAAHGELVNWEVKPKRNGASSLRRHSDL